MTTTKLFLGLFALILIGQGCVTLTLEPSSKENFESDTFNASFYALTEESRTYDPNYLSAESTYDARAITVSQEIWNEDETQVIITWRYTDHENDHGIKQIFITEPGSHGGETFLLEGDLNHLYIDDVQWQGDEIHYSVYTVDEGGVRIEEKILN